MESDRTFLLEVEGLRLQWPFAPITAATIKALAGRHEDDSAVVLEQVDSQDRVLKDDEIVDLSQPAVEVFRRRKRPAEIEISVNGKAFPIRRGVKTGLEIKQAAIDTGVAIQLDFVLSLEVGPGQTSIIGDQDRVRVKSGQQYLAIADDDNS